MNIPPLLLTILIIFIIIATGYWVPIAGMPIAGMLTTLLALSWALWAVLVFKNAKTTVNPLKPESVSRLVTWGPYAYSRNPMYVSFLGLVIASGLFMGNPICLPAAIFFVWVMNKQIRREENAIQNHFPQFRAYTKKVRRWI